eukprot:6685187-Alexandrium_andersonii.AAC.1
MARNLQKFGARLSRGTTLRTAPPALGSALFGRGSDFLQTPSRGEGGLARRASWGPELLGWTLRPGPIFQLRLTG